MTSNIIPTVFSTTKREFKHRFEKLLKLSKNIQIDLMDGKFVKSVSVKVSDIPDLNKYNNNFEAHLMMQQPQKYIPDLKRKGFTKVIFPYESQKGNIEINDLIKKIRDSKMQAFIAINPETSISNLTPFARKVDGVLLMGVNPGQEHQEFIKSVYEKIISLKEFNKNVLIQVDGGINEVVARRLGEVGADILNSGSFISDSKNPVDALRQLNSSFIEGKALSSNL